MPLPEPIMEGIPSAPMQDSPRKAPEDVIRQYTARCPAATDGEVRAALDGWDAGAYLSHWLRRRDTDDSADLGPAGRQ